MKVWCAVLTAAVALAACGQNANTPQQLETEIQQRGARAVVQQLTAGKGANWDRVVRQIQTGDQKWIEVARSLRAGTDAGNTESLYYAVSYALLKAPEHVLSVISEQFPLEAICSVPDIEPSAAKVRSHVQEAKAALAKVHDPQLASVRDRCIASFDKLSH